MAEQLDIFKYFIEHVRLMAFIDSHMLQQLFAVILLIIHPLSYLENT